MTYDIFVREAAQLAGFALDEAALAEVTLSLERIAGFAQLLEDIPLALEDEAAPIWRP